MKMPANKRYDSNFFAQNGHKFTSRFMANRTRSRSTLLSGHFDNLQAAVNSALAIRKKINVSFSNPDRKLEPAQVREIEKIAEEMENHYRKLAAGSSRIFSPNYLADRYVDISKPDDYRGNLRMVKEVTDLAVKVRANAKKTQAK